MKYLRLLGHMIRYKSALVLLLFLVLGVMVHGQKLASLLSLHTVVAAMCLVFLYAKAARTNDLVGVEGDKISVKGDRDRALVSGEASRQALWILLVVTGVIARTLA